jgi:ribosome-associated translation inhibitor RaiA
MIERITINGVHTVVDEDLNKYVTKKIGKLDTFMSRHSRESAHVEIKLKEAKAKDKKQATCEVEAKLRNQLKKYKQTHEQSYRLHRRLLSRVRRGSKI